MSRANLTVRLDGTGTPDDALSVLVMGVLEEFDEDLETQLAADVEGAANAGRDQLRRTSPYNRGSGRGHYRSGWQTIVNWRDADRMSGPSAIIYNRNKPTLAHLLEYGHDLVRYRSRRGWSRRVVGHVGAMPHIDDARRVALQYLKQRGW